MPSEILSEYICKTLYFRKLGREQKILQINHKNLVDNKIISFPQWVYSTEKFVCKVDQEIKHRKNQGLVIINKSFQECLDWIKEQAFDNFIIEPFYPIVDEYYLMFHFDNDSDKVFFSKNGGVNFKQEDLITTKSVHIDPLIKKIDFEKLDITDLELQSTVSKLYELFCDYGFSFMEVNPLAKLNDGKYVPIDFAVKYDTTGTYKWSSNDLELLSYLHKKDSDIEIEKKIKDLDESTGASLKFTLLNKNGSIWTLVAGGGASVLYTDAIFNAGLGPELGNYGEYSGNPPTAYVYKYTSLIFDTILKSNTNKPIKILVGGGISNFTDVEKTFAGILKAITEKADKLKERGIEFFVRRGGLNYKQGLAKFRKICQDEAIKCTVYGPETHITNFIYDIFNSPKPKLIDMPEISIPSELREKIKLTVESDIQRVFYGKDSKIVIINYMPTVVQRILDYDYLCQKENPSVVGIIHPPKKGNKFTVFWGSKQIQLPVFGSLDDALEYNNNIDVVISYHSFRSAFESGLNALENKNIKTVAIIAEGIAERDARVLSLVSRKLNKTLIGPSTVGSLMVESLRIGNTCGSMQNIKDLKLHQKGNVSIVTRSGGLLNEMCNIVSQTTNGTKEGVSIGGDRYPGSTFLDHIKRYEKDDNVKLICLLGEVGGILELEVAEAVKNGIIKKPVIGWVMGTSASELGDDIQFGHAGSMAVNSYETANFKNYYMKSCGIIVPDCFEDIQELIHLNAEKLGISEREYEKDIPHIPEDYSQLVKESRIRKPSEFISSISNESKDILEYNSVPVTEIITSGSAIGKTIGHLLFKKDLPEYFAKFLEMVVVLCADHGIAVSSAHNTAVCARAGQNLSAAVASGLLCIHEKHGGAMQAAAEEFYNSKYVLNENPQQFVNRMRSENRYIPGIGHLYKNATTRRDKRIDLLQAYIEEHFPNFDLVKYARSVEEITLRKRENLILNVDGLFAIATVSAFLHHYGEQGVKSLLELQSLNSLFIIARTIGLCSTFADQHRLKQGLYRHPLTGVTYIE